MHKLIGAKITKIRSLTKKELEYEGWEGRAVTAIVFDNGCILYASSDEEGNGPGALFAYDKNQDTAFLLN